jgi:hypothetical protein
MAHHDFIFNVNTLAGCRFSILRELEKEYAVEGKYLRKLNRSKYLSRIITTLGYFDRLKFKKLSRGLEIRKPPIYILGHWRSGTTLLYDLLYCFKNISYPTTYQTVFPNNLFFFKGIMKRIMQYFLPSRRLVDRVRMHVDFPQEEDFALGNEEGFSFYYWFYFPNDHRRISEKFLAFSDSDPATLRKYREGYIRFIKRCLINIGGDQYIAKNPPSMARIPFLLDLFPRSRFIFIERNPYEVLASTFRFNKGFLKTLQLQDVEDETLWEFIFQTYITLHRKYHEDRLLVPKGDLEEVRYEDLVADPESIFRSFQKGLLSDLEVDEERLQASLKSHKNHRPNQYHFDREYLKRVNSVLGDLILDQGYPVLT